MKPLMSTFIRQRYETCRGCDLQWNIYSEELEAAFTAHQAACVAKHSKGR